MTAAPRRLVVMADPAYRTAHANPYNALLYRALEARGVEVLEMDARLLARRAPDVLHVHWPELSVLSARRPWRVLGRAAVLGTALAVARRRGGTVLVWTVHNLDAHESATRPWVAHLFWRWWRRRVDAVHVLAESTRPALRERMPRLDVPVHVVPHGDYRDELAGAPDRAGARERLGLAPHAPVVAFVGQVRPYKGVEHLLGTFRDLDDPDAVLVVAGSARDEGLTGRLRAAAAADGRVVLELRHQPAERLATWLSAADLVVLPYGAVLNSGSALLALSADRPVLVPSTGSLAELAAEVGPRWASTFEGALTTPTLAGALARAVAARDDGARAPLDGRSWAAVAARTEEAYRAVRPAGR